MGNDSGIPKRSGTVIINDDGEVPSLLDPTTGRILILNNVAKRIVELADGSHTVGAIIEEVSREFRGAEQHDVAGQVTQFLAEGTEKGVIEWTSP